MLLPFLNEDMLRPIIHVATILPAILPSAWAGHHSFFLVAAIPPLPISELAWLAFSLISFHISL